MSPTQNLNYCFHLIIVRLAQTKPEQQKLGARKSLLRFREVERGIQEVELNIQELYPDPVKRNQFKQKLDRFLESDPCNRKVIDTKFLECGLLKYQTECIIPTKRDSLRVPLLLLLGNPASHSVHYRMPFSYEGKLSCKGEGKDHRFWKALRDADILRFTEKSSDANNLNVAERCESRKRELYNLSYKPADFRIGLATFYSMPSGASDEWGGVKGLYKLFGKKALGKEKIAKFEKHRLENLVRNFLSPKGAIFAFQKDAYSEIRSCKSPEYSLDKAKKGKLFGVCQCDSNVRLFCLPPTRNIQGKRILELLCNFKERVLKSP